MVEDDAGRIWIGTINGMSCFDGENLINYEEEYGLRDIHHWWCAVKDKSGQLWFATLCGIYRTDGKHFQWLTKDNGLPSNFVSGLLPQQDRSMIINTQRGIIRYCPTATLTPKIEIRDVLADRIYQNRIELELSTTATNLLTISYHSLSLATKRMRYSYILEGYDKEWRETWERQVRYENLSTAEKANQRFFITVLHSPKNQEQASSLVIEKALLPMQKRKALGYLKPLTAEHSY